MTTSTITPPALHLDDPKAWGLRGDEPDWYNRKQCLTLFELPIGQSKPGHISTWPKGKPLINTIKCLSMAHGNEVVARVCFFWLLTRDDAGRCVETCFLADGRQFATSVEERDAILSDWGISDHSRTWQGVVYQGSPLGNFIDPTT